ncbi:zinc finger protein, putative, partial [Bodo saltans]
MASLMSAPPPLSEAEILGTLNMDCACCICFQPPLPHQAVVVVPCHHLFCRPCLDQAMTKKVECPVDRAPIDGTLVRVEAADEASLSLVQSVGVQCSARRHGCQWEGQWGQWVAEDHGATCSFRGHGVVAVCRVPSCPAGGSSSESTAASILPPSDHESTYLYEHIRLLSHTVKALEEQNRTLKWEMDQLKERLYSAQNDISDWQHASRREREASESSEQRFLQQLNILATNTRPLFPTITVPGVSSLDDQPSASSLHWDENCCSRSASVDQGTLTH